MTERTSRRKVLSLAGLGLTGLAGCISVNTDPRGESDETPTPTDGVNGVDSGSSFNFSNAQTTEESISTTTEEQEVGDYFTTECSDAYVTNFDWSDGGLGEDTFTATVINQGDVAGEVIVKVTFYETEDKEIRTGNLKRRVAISAQESKDIIFEANPPTDDSSWASMSLDEQACVTNVKE